jgi:hypothetical protein
MVMPSLLSLVIAAAALALLSVLLRHLANEAYDMARSRRRVSVAAGPKNSNTYRRAA